MINPEALTLNEQKMYKAGIHEGIYRFAWMKDGVYYVGTCGTTLKEARARLDAEFPELAQKEKP